MFIRGQRYVSQEKKEQNFGFTLKLNGHTLKSGAYICICFPTPFFHFNTFIMKKYFSDRLPENLRQLRAYHQFPQRYVAHILNCSQYGYSKLERGQMRLSETRLSQLAQLYRLPPVDLLDKSSDELIRQIIDGKPLQEVK